MNMAEILKAAGCGYTNGERALPFFACAQDNSFNFSTTDRSFTIFFLFLLLPEVVKTTVLLADMNDFTSVNDVYKQCEYQ